MADQPPPLMPPPVPAVAPLPYRVADNGPSPERQRTARSLVSASAWLGWGGLLVVVGGAVLLFAAMFAPPTVPQWVPPMVPFALPVVGVVMTVVGAILGQIGRAMQGRVV